MNYKFYFKQKFKNIKRIVLFLSIQVIVLILLYLTLNTYLWNFVQYQNLKESQYNYSLITNKLIHSNSYLFLDDEVLFYQNNFEIYNNNNIAMNTEVFMMLSDMEYSVIPYNMYQETLAENEIAISKNLAKNYNLKNGDTLFTNLATDNYVTSYTIKYIFEYCYGMVKPNSSLGVVVIGNISRIESNLENTYFTFSVEDLAQTLNNDNSIVLIEWINKTNEMSFHFNNIFVITIIVLLTMAILILFPYIYNTKSNINYIKKLIINGLYKKKSIYFTLWDNVVNCLGLFCIFWIIGFLIVGGDIIHLFFICIPLIIEIALLTIFISIYKINKVMRL